MYIPTCALSQPAKRRALPRPLRLGWYGWYKFSVEEELFYDELRREGRTSGCGGYGTLILFSWLVLLGGVGTVAGIDGADFLIELGAAWILLGQVNLYRRVNELLEEQEVGSAPVHAWWALLPPPLDVVVGLRQVHCACCSSYHAPCPPAQPADRLAQPRCLLSVACSRGSLRAFASLGSPREILERRAR